MMSTIVSPLSDFYQKENFNPTFVDISDVQKVSAQFQKRLNLYVNKLKLPQKLFRSSKVLEFGCSSGENALLLAALGGEMYFVEPLQASTDRLKSIFEQYGYAESVKTIYNETIEDYEDKDGPYDVVIAEGFLHCLPPQSRKQQLEKIIELLNDNGLLILSTADPYGQFVQLFKIFLFRYLSFKKHLETDTEKLALARELFEEEYNKIPHSRPFEMYIKDTFYNPCYGKIKFWGFEEILPTVLERNFHLYSSWPYYRSSDNFLWHKYTPDLEELGYEQLSRYRISAPQFIAAEELTQHDALWADSFLSAVAHFLNQLDESVATSFRKFPSKDTLENLQVLLQKYYPNSKTVRLLYEVKKILTSITESHHEGIALYKASSLTTVWGMPYHYLVFSRDVREGMPAILNERMGSD